jgi:hypothetical protein
MKRTAKLAASGTTLVVAALGLLSGPTTAWAQDPNAPKAPAKDAGAPKAQQPADAGAPKAQQPADAGAPKPAAAKAPEEKPRGPGEVTFDVVERPLKDVVAFIQDKTDVNIVIAKEAEDIPVTVKLRNLPWREALDIVVERAGQRLAQRLRVATLHRHRDLRRSRPRGPARHEHEPEHTQ